MSANLRRTPEGVCVSVTVPTSLPSADLRPAVAAGAGEVVGFGAAGAMVIAPASINTEAPVASRRVNAGSIFRWQNSD